MECGTDPLFDLLGKAVEAGQLRASALAKIELSLRLARSEVARASVAELANAGAWTELNDRFYKTLAFGTGGLRGRTIGKIVTAAERGSGTDAGPPEFPCTGTNAMNFENVARATRGLAAYVRDWTQANGGNARPSVVIAHDTRYFSKEFAELAARVTVESGCDAFLFNGPRSTPELSFAVRHLNATAGVVITASHNPPHDNGYKVYFNDGAQVVEPHASGIIERANADKGATDLLQHPPGRVTTIGSEVDDAYLARLETLVIDRELVESQSELRIVFTPIHGTGAIITRPLLERLGFKVEGVAKQEQLDGGFPTVKSPNPENAEALTLAIKLAETLQADLVVATDPDCDRMGAAVRTAAGKMQLLTGNQIGSLIAYYRARALFEHGILTKENAGRAVIIKTFVTTDLQKAIAQYYGLRCVETLTGFKYIGAKLGKYEKALGYPPEEYRRLSEEETRRLRLECSSYYVFGGEESYGYSGADFVRDKDGNGAAVMFCEVAAHAKSRGLTLDALLDEIYITFGYYHEKNGSLTFEGAEGAENIKRLLSSYVTNPPAKVAGVQITRVSYFETDTILDVEGDVIPKEKMLMFELADRTRIAVRGSGTEPKIKYYLFGQAPAGTTNKLAQVKQETTARLDALWEWIQTDASIRVA